mgnify:CR=1 FL=1
MGTFEEWIIVKAGLLKVVRDKYEKLMGERE